MEQTKVECWHKYEHFIHVKITPKWVYILMSHLGLSGRGNISYTSK